MYVRLYHELGHVVFVELTQSAAYLAFGARAEFDGTRYCYSSFHIPWRQFRLPLETKPSFLLRTILYNESILL